MSFTQNWFETLGQQNFETLKNMIDINQPLNVLEIGCFQGNCHLWLYKNILTHPKSKSTVIDPFEKSLTHQDSYKDFTNNLKNYLNRITICKGFSDDILPTLEKESFDIIYIDGDHSSIAAYNDGVNSIPLLKKHGIIIFDDYLWNGIFINDFNDIHRIGGDINPCKGINKFLKEYNNNFNLMEGFIPPIQIIDIDRLYIDDNYQQNYINKINYQMFIQKISL